MKKKKLNESFTKLQETIARWDKHLHKQIETNETAIRNTVGSIVSDLVDIKLRVENLEQLSDNFSDDRENDRQIRELQEEWNDFRLFSNEKLKELETVYDLGKAIDSLASQVGFLLERTNLYSSLFAAIDRKFAFLAPKFSKKVPEKGNTLPDIAQTDPRFYEILSEDYPQSAKTFTIRKKT